MMHNAHPKNHRPLRFLNNLLPTNHEKKGNSMKVLLINNDGGGFADHIEIDEGTTVTQLFEQQIGSSEPSDYLIRVNRQPCAKDQVLKQGDRITITPTKIEGAIQ